ncbi:MAG: hypothetical protein IKX62_02145, partial [Bacteroidales bacterium]|nr:hypothetical protein [Bacteroidales bacterium]
MKHLTLRCFFLFNFKSSNYYVIPDLIGDLLSAKATGLRPCSLKTAAQTHPAPYRLPAHCASRPAHAPH